MSQREETTGVVGYVRFVVPGRDTRSGSLQGIIQAVSRLDALGQLEPHENLWLLEDMRWLNEHVKVPGCLSDPENRRAICWFRPHATRAINKARSIATLLKTKGIPVEMITTRDPGVVIYEDGLQVAAKPRRKRGRS